MCKAANVELIGCAGGNLDPLMAERHSR